MTLEDEASLIDVIVRPQVYANYRTIWRNESLLLVDGQIQREGEVVNVLANSVVPISKSQIR